MKEIMTSLIGVVILIIGTFLVTISQDVKYFIVLGIGVIVLSIAQYINTSAQKQ